MSGIYENSFTLLEVFFGLSEPPGPEFPLSPPLPVLPSTQSSVVSLEGRVSHERKQREKRDLETRESEDTIYTLPGNEKSRMLQASYGSERSDPHIEQAPASSSAKRALLTTTEEGPVPFQVKATHSRDDVTKHGISDLPQRTSGDFLEECFGISALPLPSDEFFDPLSLLPPSPMSAVLPEGALSPGEEARASTATCSSWQITLDEARRGGTTVMPTSEVDTLSERADVERLRSGLLLRRSRNSIKQQKSLLGHAPTSTRIPWTPEEKEIVRKNSHLGPTAIHRLFLPKRSITAIAQQKMIVKKESGGSMRSQTDIHRKNQANYRG